MFAWACYGNNGQSSFKDYVQCNTFSRRTWKTREEAERASKRHRCKYGTMPHIEIKNIGRRKWK